MASRNTLRLYLDADGTPVVRTFHEIGDASEQTAGKIDKSSKASTLGLAEMEKGTSRLRGAVGALAGTIGVTGLAFGIKDVIDAGEKWQLQQAQLATALKNTGQYSKQTLAQVVSSSEQLSVHGGFAGPQELEAMNQFIRLTGSATEAIKLNRAATDLSRGTTLSYGSAQMILGQALTGNTGKLQKYLGIIEPVKTAEFALTQAHGLNLVALMAQSKALGKLGPQWLAQQEVLHSITPTEMQHAQLLDRQATATLALQRIQQRYGNSTVVFSRTTSGAISNLSNRFDLLGKTIGKDVLPFVTSVVGFMSSHTSVIFGVAAAVTALTIAWGINAAVTTAIIGEWTIASAAAKLLAVTMGFLSGVTETLAIAFVVMGVDATVAWAMATLGVSLLIAGLVLLITHFSTVESVAASVFNWLKGAVMDVVHWIGDHWKGLLILLTGPFGIGVVLIVDHLNQIKTFAIALIGRLGSAFSTLFHIITWPFVQAWNIIKAIFDKIRDGFKTILGPLGSVLHFASGVGGAVGGFLAHPFGLHNGGIVHAATGGILGGWGGGDRVPAMLEAGEGILRKEAVSGIGNSAFNAINTNGTLPPNAAADEVYVSAPIYVTAGSRIIAEVTAHFVARKSALSGGYVSG
jgi:hypothetical protein